MYYSALKTCGVELLLKVGTLLPEMAAHEKSLDFFIDLLRKDQVETDDFIHYIMFNWDTWNSSGKMYLDNMKAPNSLVIEWQMPSLDHPIYEQSYHCSCSFIKFFQIYDCFRNLFRKPLLASSSPIAP